VSTSYTQSDYVLYSITGSETRGDESGLSFSHLLQQAERAAWAEGAKSWQRAKATLQTWFELMFECPDVTKQEAWRLLDVHLKRLNELRERSTKLRTLPVKPQRHVADPVQEELDKAASLIEL
jgi:hypothetical protein